MNLLDIDAVSYATHLGQHAASEIARLLWAIEPAEAPIVNWYEASPGHPETFLDPGEAAELRDGETGDLLVDRDLETLGGQICRQGIDRGEWLWREARERSVAPANPEWADMPYAQRQAWETFVGVTRQSFNQLRAQQLALEEAGRPGPGTVPVKLKREDSIFEEETSLGELRPEAVAALRKSPEYERAAQQVRDDKAAEQAAIDAAAAARTAKNASSKKARAKTAGDKVQRAAKAMSVGEPPVKAPVNRGGRGRKKPEATE